MGEWEAVICGPEGTPYYGGVYELDISLPKNYPYSPPNVVFKTKIYHCNIYENGSICLDILTTSKWIPSYDINKVLTNICALLCSPNPHSSAFGEAGRKLREDKNAHDEIAREWTRRYAN